MFLILSYLFLVALHDLYLCCRIYIVNWVQLLVITFTKALSKRAFNGEMRQMADKATVKDSNHFCTIYA